MGDGHENSYEKEIGAILDEAYSAGYTAGYEQALSSFEALCLTPGLRTKEVIKDGEDPKTTDNSRTPDIDGPLVGDNGATRSHDPYDE